jgi:hypothetical protein
MGMLMTELAILSMQSEMSGKIHAVSSRVDNLVDRRVGKAKLRTLAKLVALAIRDNPVESTRERGGIVL